MKRLARERNAAAIQTLAEIAGDDRAPTLARVVTANAILDGGWGKPQAEAAEDMSGVAATLERVRARALMSDEEIAARLERLRA